jgi:seryl-tRNA synthetase
MLDINFIRQNPDKVKEGVQLRGGDPGIVDRVLKVDETRRQLIGEIEKLRAERNKLGPKDIEKGRKIKETLRRLEPDLQAVEEELKNLLYEIPNLPSQDTPPGKSEADNVEVRVWLPEKGFAKRKNW